MISIKKNATFAVVLGALTALFPSISMADGNEESAALEGETNTSVDELSTADRCTDFCQAEYIDCMGYGPREGERGAHAMRLPSTLRRSPCHRRYRRCLTRCDIEDE
jgi:hypothetical protein